MTPEVTPAFYNRIQDAAPYIIEHSLTKFADPLTIGNTVLTASPEMIPLWREGDMLDKSGPEYDPLLDMIGEGLPFLPYGDQWKLQRGIAMTHFGSSIVSSFQTTLESRVPGIVESVVADGGTEDIHATLKAAMFRLASQVLFDYDVTPQDAAVISRAYGDFAAYVLRNNVLRGLPDEGRERISFATLSRKETPPLSSDTVRDMALRRIFSSMNSSVNEALPVMHQYSNDVYEYGKASEEDHIVHEYEKAGLSREQILAEIFIMQAGFHSSTASILSSGLGVLGTPAMHQYQDRLRESLWGGKTDELHRALLEVGRLYPPFWVLTRTVLRDFELDGKKVPAGKQMGFVVYAANRSTKVFGDDAADFRPDRFVEEPQLRGKLGLFGFGRRRCPSGDLGMRSASQFMTEFLSRQQVRSAHTNVPMEFEATLRPRKLALDFEAAA